MRSSSEPWREDNGAANCHHLNRLQIADIVIVIRVEKTRCFLVSPEQLFPRQRAGDTEIIHFSRLYAVHSQILGRKVSVQVVVHRL